MYLFNSFWHTWPSVFVSLAKALKTKLGLFPSYLFQDMYLRVTPGSQVLVICGFLCQYPDVCNTNNTTADLCESRVEVAALHCVGT